MSRLGVSALVVVFFSVYSEAFRIFPVTRQNVHPLYSTISLSPTTTKEVSVSEGLQREELIAEEMVTDDLSASLLADRCMAEAKRLFTSKANWKKVDLFDRKDITVETIPLSGGYENSGKLVRSFQRVAIPFLIEFLSFIYTHTCRCSSRPRYWNHSCSCRKVL